MLKPMNNFLLSSRELDADVSNVVLIEYVMLTFSSGAAFSSCGFWAAAGGADGGAGGVNSGALPFCSHVAFCAVATGVGGEEGCEGLPFCCCVAFCAVAVGVGGGTGTVDSGPFPFCSRVRAAGCFEAICFTVWLTLTAVVDGVDGGGVSFGA
jgi:hypothetical protein